jgi:hypothetical protein
MVASKLTAKSRNFYSKIQAATKVTGQAKQSNFLPVEL